jgi:hypothetical protein
LSNFNPDRSTASSVHTGTTEAALARFGNGPLIAKLVGEHRMTVNDRMRRGDYGHSFMRGGIRYVDLGVVAEFHGLLAFPREQLAAAADGRDSRILEVA